MPSAANRNLDGKAKDAEGLRSDVVHGPNSVRLCSLSLDATHRIYNLAFDDSQLNFQVLDIIKLLLVV